MREAPMVVLECTRCQKEFERKPYRVKKNKNAFCSHSCQVRYGVEQLSLKSKSTCTCTNCGKDFETSTKGLKRRNKKYGIFCTKKCYYEFISGKDFSTYIDLTCSVCGKVFSRKASIERSSRKTFLRICCSRKCSSAVEHDSVEDLKARLFYQLSGVIRHGTIEVGEDVTGEYLLEVWNKQNQKCVYTGEPLVLKYHRKRGEKLVNQASIDRIDSSKGYVRGNIEFVSLMANYAKNSWTKEQFIEFCKAVARHA